MLAWKLGQACVPDSKTSAGSRAKSRARRRRQALCCEHVCPPLDIGMALAKVEGGGTSIRRGSERHWSSTVGGGCGNANAKPRPCMKRAAGHRHEAVASGLFTAPRAWTAEPVVHERSCARRQKGQPRRTYTSLIAQRSAIRRNMCGREDATTRRERQDEVRYATLAAGIDPATSMSVHLAPLATATGRRV